MSDLSQAYFRNIRFNSFCILFNSCTMSSRSTNPEPVFFNIFEFRDVVALRIAFWRASDSFLRCNAAARNFF